VPEIMSKTLAELGSKFPVRSVEVMKTLSSRALELVG